MGRPIFAVVLALGAVLATGPAAGESATARPTPPTLVKAIFLPDQPVKGPTGARITIIVIGDFQCPFCGRVQKVLRQVEAIYGDDVRFVWANNPLPFHPAAEPAALAAMAAHEQGKFWAFHDRIFADQAHEDPATFERYATELGLDVPRWKKAFQSQKYAGQIQEEIERYAKLGARGTPSFFINGVPFNGAQPFEAFKSAIDDAVKRADAELGKGTPPSELYAALIRDGVTSRPAGLEPGKLDPIYVDAPADAPALGPADARATIVEFADFECPFCAKVAPTLDALRSTYGNDVRIVFRNLPLPTHPHARLAAEAAMAAHEQGKFWPMYAELYANREHLERADLVGYARKVGLDVPAFEAALDSGKEKARVDGDIAAAALVGARGTPTFFINGMRVGGAEPVEYFRTAIDAALKRADAELARGTSRAKLYLALSHEPAVEVPVRPDEPSLGPKNAPVTLVEFGDFQCPFSGRSVATVNSIRKMYGDRVRFVFRNLPLPMHEHAELAAEASLAAGEQGKYWPMYDQLFAHQDRLERSDIEGYARTIGLDLHAFDAALDGRKEQAKVQADMVDAEKVAAHGTPTFFVNGVRISGAQPLTTFQPVIDGQLAGKP